MAFKSSIINKSLVMGALAAIFILGLFLRFSVLAGTVVDTPVRADAKKYVTYAYNLSHYGVYSGHQPRNSNKTPVPDAVITPGYPIYLNLFLDEDGPILWSELRSSLLVQTLLSSLCVIIVFFIFSPMVGQWLSLLVALLTALSPHLITVNVYLLTESLFAFLMMAWLFTLVSLRNKKATIGVMVLCGALLAAAALTRSWIQYFIVILVFFIIFSKKMEQRNKTAYGIVGGFFLVFLIWVIRNLVSTDGNDSSLMLATLHHGMYPGMMYELNPKSFGFPYRFDPESAFITESITNFFSVLWARFLEEPWRYVSWYLWGKASMVMSWDIIAGFGDVFIYPITKTPYQNDGLFRWTHDVMHYLHVPLTCMAILGTIVAWFPAKMATYEKSQWQIRLVSLVFIYFIIIHMIAAPFPRYSIPIRPLVYGLAVYFMVEVWRRATLSRFVGVEGG